MATSPEERVELVRRGFEAYNAGDPTAVLELFHPEVEVYAPPEFMNAGRFHGHEGWLAWVTAWNDAWESFEIDVQAIEPIGERHAVAAVRQTGRGRGSGAQVELSVSYLYEIRDGLGVYLGLYADHETALAAARDRESTAE